MNSVIEKLNSFQDRRRAIQEDRQLSDVGKSAQLARLQAEIDAYQSDALTFLKADWRRVRRRHDELTVRQRLENERAGSQWSYDRLNYAAAAVRSAVRAAPDLATVEKQYDQAVQAGDRHAIRAWGETAPGAIAERFARDVDRGRLERRMTADLKAVLTTPEMAEITADGKKLADDVLALHNDTQAVSQFYSPGAAFSLGPDEFQKLAQNVTITRTYQPEEDFAHFEMISVEFTDVPASEAAPAGVMA